MKLFEDDGAKLIALAILAVITLIVSKTAYNIVETNYALQNGLQQCALQGNVGYVWKRNCNNGEPNEKD